MKKKTTIKLSITSLFSSLLSFIASGADLAVAVLKFKTESYFSCAAFCLLSIWTFACGVICLKSQFLLWEIFKNIKE